MLERLLYEVEIVRITAPTERDAFRLFETPNDRGLALSAADLIKNKLFSRCKDDLDDIVESWAKIIALTSDDDVVVFLRAYWIACHGFVRKNGLYDTYKAYVEKLTPKDAALVVLDLEDQAAAYQEIVSPVAQKCLWGPDVGGSLERLNLFRAKSCRSVLLAAARYSTRLIGDDCPDL